MTGAADGWSRWPAPAKLNLFLHIVGRRDDGYHLLQSVFQLLDRGDAVHLHVREDGRIRRVRGATGVDEVDDLAVRAARALQAASACPHGVDIAIDKHIPLGGGLGGGSSDAATVLVALNLLWATGLEPAQLARLGLALGADVPVFVHGHSAWAEGIGEQLTPLALAPRWYVVVDAGCSVPTRELFAAPELTRTAAPLTIARFRAGAVTGNAFEPLVRARFPGVATALDWLGGFGVARLSGSGGCSFVAVESAAQAEAIAQQCPAPLRAWVAQGVDRAPLLAARAQWLDARRDGPPAPRAGPAPG
ncbi:MAG: 4-(cytidine 5'-diphospho)-2-C-methyl-D-erythritol kinase [Rhodanobacteraceae bacterium]|nr:4-(cytidine 5'-diphospho)-2-C-methyl-D-erythritol kinase [Rhodanobacteraceae bacterium]